MHVILSCTSVISEVGQGRENNVLKVRQRDIRIVYGRWSVIDGFGYISISGVIVGIGFLSTSPQAGCLLLVHKRNEGLCILHVFVMQQRLFLCFINNLFVCRC